MIRASLSPMSYLRFSQQWQWLSYGMLMQCSMVEVHWNFSGMYCFHLVGWISHTRNHQKQAATKACLAYSLTLKMGSAATCPHWFFARGFFYPEDGGDTFSETLVNTRPTQRHIPENDILHWSSSSFVATCIHMPCFHVTPYVAI
jgi:hypothetical protein